MNVKLKMKFAAIIAGLCSYASAFYTSEYDQQPMELGQPISDLGFIDKGELIVGIFWGVISKEGADNLQTCVGDLKDEGAMVEDAWVKLHKGPLHFAAGLHELYEAVRDIPSVIGDCRIIHDDIQTLEAWIANLEAQDDLEAYIKHNVERHLLALTNDLRKARSEYAAEEYWQCGVELGNMLVIATQ